MNKQMQADMEIAAQEYACGFPSEEAAFQEGVKWCLDYLNIEPTNTVCKYGGSSIGIIDSALKISKRLEGIAERTSHNSPETTRDCILIIANLLKSAKKRE